MTRRRVVVCAAAMVLCGCATTIRRGPIIDRYAHAPCIPVRTGEGTHASRRVWDYTLTRRDGGSVHVSGSTPAGRIDVRLPDGTEHVAGTAGDYIYPADVRLDQPNERLYVRASGQRASFGSAQTWLFEYDLRAMRQVARALVDPHVLPAECPVTP